MKATRPAAVALAILYIALWASAYVPSKVASTETAPLWFLAVRFLAAGGILAALAVAMRRPFPATRDSWIAAAALGVLANVCYLGLTYIALRQLSAGMGAIVASTNPLVLALIAPRVLGERLGFWKGVGLVLGFGGVVALVIARSGTGTARPADVALAFAGVLASVASTVLFKRMASGTSLIALNAVQLATAGLVMIPLAFAFSGAPPRVTFTPELVTSFAYLVLVLSVGASLLWFWLLGRGEASRVSAYYYLTPAFGLALSALLLGERVSPHDIVGLIAIAGGIALVQRA